MTEADSWAFSATFAIVFVLGWFFLLVGIDVPSRGSKIGGILLIVLAVAYAIFVFATMTPVRH